MTLVPPMTLYCFIEKVQEIYILMMLPESVNNIIIAFNGKNFQFQPACVVS